MPAQAIKVTPTEGKGGKIDWELCHKAPGKAEVCGDAVNGYPVIDLGPNAGGNSGHQRFTVTIDDVQKLGITFSSDPLWIQANTKPTKHTIDPIQIYDVEQTSPTVLKFKDKNKDDPVTLVYQLNFVGADQKPVTSIDPDIRNGGTTITSYDQATILLAGAGLALLLGAIWLSIRSIRNRRNLNTGGHP